MKKNLFYICAVGISFGAVTGMGPSGDVQSQSVAIGRLCTPVLNSATWKAFLKTNREEAPSLDDSKPSMITTDYTERAVRLASKFILPENLAFLPESTESDSLIIRWRTVPFELKGVGLQPPVVYKKEIGAKILAKLSSDGTLFEKGIACYFAGDLFKTIEGSLFLKHIMPELVKQHPELTSLQRAKQYWVGLYNALVQYDAYKEIQNDILVELKKRGIRIRKQ